MKSLVSLIWVVLEWVSKTNFESIQQLVTLQRFEEKQATLSWIYLIRTNFWAYFFVYCSKKLQTDWHVDTQRRLKKLRADFASGGICSILNFLIKLLPQDVSNPNHGLMLINRIMYLKGWQMLQTNILYCICLTPRRHNLGLVEAVLLID